jgi:hypothetical protein
VIQRSRGEAKPVPAVEAIYQFVQAKEQLEDTIMTTREVADHYGVTRGAVNYWVKQGLLKPCAELDGYGHVFDRNDVEQFQQPLRGKPSHKPRS